MKHHTPLPASSPPRPAASWLRTLLTVMAVAAAAPHARAQVAVRLQINKPNYILNEPVTATVHISNHSGRQLVLRTENGRPWLNFHITSRGRVIPTARKVSYGALVLPSGQTKARTVTLNLSHALGSMGNYTCQASVNMPGPTRNGFLSNRGHFTVTSGRPVWTQRAGIPKAPGEIREYKLLTFSGNRALELFAEVSSANRRQNIATIPLGKILTFRRPTGTLDKSNNMHALYQVKPNLFGHTCVSPGGKVMFTTYHKRGASGDPRLITFGNGEVRVAGGILYNAKAEAEQRRKIRKASERPPFIYR